MKILITGATGLVGNALTKLLLENGVVVHYLTTSQKKIVDKPNYHGFYWNTTNGFIDENALMGVDAIVHLAGASVAKRWTSSYKQEIVESRTLTADLLFRAIKNHPNQVKHFVSASGVGVYRDSLTAIYSEGSTDLDNTFLSNVVEKWENSADKFKQLGLKVCKLRTGIVLSNKGGAMVEMLKPIRFGLGAAFGSGKQVQSWIHIDDLVRMYFFAVQNQLEGTFNAVAPNPVSNQKLTSALAKQRKKPLFLPNIPKFMINLLLGEMHQILFSSQNVSSKKIENAGFRFDFVKVDEAIDDLLHH
jgi:uncharacterized protein (TIGR01777 family)